MLIRKKLEQILGSKLEHPVREEWGDYSVFAESPEEAEKLIKQIKQSELNKLIEQIEVVGKGFINIRLKVEYLISQMFPVLNKKTGRVMVEYSSPNIAKTFGIGHLRSTIIGQALYNIYKSLGYEVIGDNHLGDWGTQFGKLLYMLDREKLNAQGATLCVEDLEKLYVRYHKISEDDKQARKWFKRLEDGDKLARKLWEKCVQISVREFARIYKLLEVKIDNAYGESFYESLMQEVVADAKTIARKSQGALVIDIPGHPPLMLLKSDGGTTYATRDLATLKFRKDKWDPDLIIYEVGAEQTLHFQQVFAAARMLGYVREGCSLIHTKHGLYLAENGKKFRTRTGSTVNLEEVLREAITRARNNPAVGIGAIKYFDLSHNVQSDIVFDWEKVMVLQGNSGPYLQYTYARAQSVLVRAKGQGLRAKNLAPSTKHLALSTVLVGTHALLSDKLQLDKVGLVVIDEQHRFGVAQRAKLFLDQSAKMTPHLLTMTATPIPRTLALTMYGDLNLSFLDEMPKGRQKISTSCEYFLKNPNSGLFNFPPQIFKVTSSIMYYFINQTLFTLAKIVQIKKANFSVSP